MALDEKDFEEAIERINSGRLRSEAQVKQAVILHILRKLGWDDTNPDEFYPEYPLRYSVQGFVDYALLKPQHGPKVFIEAKKLGGINENGEEQLFQYAYAQGVRLLILTDGDIWNFYLSMAEGVPRERLFYRAILTNKGNTAEYVQSFYRYLSKTEVWSENAIIAAEEQHTNRRAKQKAKNQIPKVWRAMLEEPPPELRNMLAMAVESECKTRPEPNDIDNFLKEQLRPTYQSAYAVHEPPKLPTISSDSSRPYASPSGTTKFPKRKTKSTRIVGYTFNGKENILRTGIETFVAILNEFCHRDPGFIDRFDQKTTEGKRTKKVVAQDPKDLFSNPRRNYEGEFDKLEKDWYVSKGRNKQDILKQIQTACEVARVAFGSELIILYD